MKLTVVLAIVASILFAVACGGGKDADAPAVAVKAIAPTDVPEPTSAPNPVSSQSPTPPPISMVLDTVSPELLSCVKTVLGDEQYDAIITGRQDAVAEQLGLVLPCILQYPQESNAIMEMFGLDMGTIMTASTPIPSTQPSVPTNTPIPQPTKVSGADSPPKSKAQKSLLERANERYGLKDSSEIYKYFTPRLKDEYPESEQAEWMMLLEMLCLDNITEVLKVTESGDIGTVTIDIKCSDGNSSGPYDVEWQLIDGVWWDAEQSTNFGEFNPAEESIVPTPTPRPISTAIPFPTPTSPPATIRVSAPTPTVAPMPTATPMPPATSTDSNYTLVVDQGQESWSGKTVTFRVGGNQAGETALWVQGGSTYLDLTAYSGYSKGVPEIYSNTRISFLAQRVPPHVFVGTAYLDGVPAPGGTAVSAWIDGVLEAETVVHETVASNLNNSASATFSVLVDNGSLEIVWKFSNASSGWTFFDPGVGLLVASTLTDVTPGDIVWVNVRSEQSFQSGTLYPGWNLVSLD